jgi:hypothetical protein
VSFVEAGIAKLGVDVEEVRLCCSRLFGGLRELKDGGLDK